MTRAGAVLLLCAVPAAGAAPGAGTGPAPAVVEVRTAAGLVARLPLDRDRTLRVDGPLGQSVVEVRGGRARFARAACTSRLCLAAGWLTRDGDTAACVPNRVYLRLRGGKHRFDSMNF